MKRLFPFGPISQGNSYNMKEVDGTVIYHKN